MGGAEGEREGRLRSPSGRGKRGKEEWERSEDNEGKGRG